MFTVRTAAEVSAESRTVCISDVQSVEAGEAEPHLSYSNVTEKQLKKN